MASELQCLTQNATFLSMAQPVTFTACDKDCQNNTLTCDLVRSSALLDIRCCDVDRLQAGERMRRCDCHFLLHNMRVGTDSIAQYCHVML